MLDSPSVPTYRRQRKISIVKKSKKVDSSPEPNYEVPKSNKPSQLLRRNKTTSANLRHLKFKHENPSNYPFLSSIENVFVKS
eukprot:UN02763